MIFQNLTQIPQFPLAFCRGVCYNTLGYHKNREATSCQSSKSSAAFCCWYPAWSLFSRLCFRESKQANGLSALDGGASETYVSRYGAKTKEKFYAKLTKILAVIFFVVSLIVDLVIKFF